jgi:hypothetical protein
MILTSTDTIPEFDENDPEFNQNMLNMQTFAKDDDFNAEEPEELKF